VADTQTGLQQRRLVQEKKTGAREARGGLCPHEKLQKAAPAPKKKRPQKKKKKKKKKIKGTPRRIKERFGSTDQDLFLPQKNSSFTFKES